MHFLTPLGPSGHVAGTMGFVTFVFFQVFNLLNVRHFTRSVFARETLYNRSAFVATAVVLVLLILVVEVPAARGFFITADLAPGQWLACVAVGSTILVIGEVVKVIARARLRG